MKLAVGQLVMTTSLVYSWNSSAPVEVGTVFLVTGLEFGVDYHHVDIYALGAEAVCFPFYVDAVDSAFEVL